MAAKKKTARRAGKPRPIKKWVRLQDGTLVSETLLNSLPAAVLVSEIARHHARTNKAQGGFSDLSHQGVAFYIHSEPGRAYGSRPPVHADLGNFHDALLGSL